jgi:TonB-linked SusC/RagA family outer membrane protein
MLKALKFSYRELDYKSLLYLKSLFIKIGRKHQILAVLVLSAIFSTTSYALPEENEFETKVQLTVSGVVTDVNGMPLSSVTVQEQGANNGTLTDFDGNFTLGVSSSESVLIFTYVGMLPVERTVGGNTTINVQMREDTESLQEVVVVGYGTQKRSDITGAVSSISANDIAGQPVANINEAIQGKVAGVNITPSSGEPGAPLQIRIRGMGTFGNSGPLYVVDGMPVNGSDVNSIDPNQIESMEILKDASASAIYGSRAANGVVLITTKVGRVGKPQMTYNGYYGMQTFNNFIPLLNSQQYAELNNDASRNAGMAPEPAFANPGSIPVDTDWQEVSYRDAPVQDHSLTISGGGEDARYSVSGGYFDQKGIMVFSSFKRYSTRVKSSFNVTDKLTIGESINLSRSLGENMGQGNNLDFAYLLGAPPTMPVYREGNLGGYGGPNPAETGRNNRDNIVARRDNMRNNSAFNKALGNVFAEYEFIPGLKYRLNLGLNFGLNTNKAYTPKYEAENRSVLIQSLNQSKNESYEYLVENLFTYEKEFESFNISLLGGYTRQNASYSYMSGSIQEFPSNELRVIDAGTGSYNLSGNEAEWALESYLGRANVTVLDRYLFTATFRRDGSSRFGAKNRFGNFPSLAVGWNVHEEGFMADVNSISSLKIRGSWGILGNQEIGNYVSQTTMNTSPRYIFGEGQAISPAAAITSLGNPGLKWEETTQTNIGVDLNMFKNALTFTADYWIKDSKGVLLRTPISVASGIGRFNGPYENAAGIKNSGFEFLLAYRKAAQDFNYEISANVSTVKNEVTTLGRGSTILNLVNNAYNFGVFTHTAVGESMSSFYGYTMDGIFQNQQEVEAHATQPGAEPGDVRFRDLNGDGIISDEDRSVIGDPFPDFTYGINLSASYKNFDAALSFTGVAGKELYNSQSAYLESMDGEHNQMATTLNRWQGEGTSNTMPRAVRGYINDNARPSTRFVEDASFFKLRNAQIGYNFSKSVANSIGVSNTRIYISGQNLFTITDYSGYNPDVLGGSGWASNDLNPLSMGVDTGTYPIPTTVQVGLQVGF